MEEIRIKPPGPHACRICATVHRPEYPHDRDSLYYQNWFYRRHKRFPTWFDAMAHCSEKIRAEYTETLARRGIVVEKGGGDG